MQASLTKFSTQYIPFILSAGILFFSSFICPAQSQSYKGKASFYADFFHGRKTANGEIFNQHKLTAAHRTLPFGTVLRVTNPRNDKSVIVRINDRGPYAKGRVIDLSKAAAKRLGFIQQGIAEVRIESVDPSEELKEYFEEVPSNETTPVMVAENTENEYIPTTSPEYATESSAPSYTPADASSMYSPAPIGISSEVENTQYNLLYKPEATFSIGRASVYPDWAEGRIMQNGEAYNSGQYTCAYNKYPIGRFLKVTRKKNPDLSIIVEVTDTQNALTDSEIQLSWAAHSHLELFEAQDKEVVIEEIIMTDLDALSEPIVSDIKIEREVEIDFMSVANPYPVVEKTPTMPEAIISLVAASSPIPIPAQNTQPAAAAAKTSGLGLFQMQATRIQEEGFGIQIAIVKEYREILGIVEVLAQNHIQNTLIHSDIVDGEAVMRLIVGPFSNKEEAEQGKKALENQYIEGTIIRLEPLQ